MFDFLDLTIFYFIFKNVPTVSWVPSFFLTNLKKTARDFKSRASAKFRHSGKFAFCIEIKTAFAVHMEATGGFEPPNRGFAVRCLGHLATSPYGAGNGIRTRDFDLGKVALYH